MWACCVCVCVCLKRVGGLVGFILISFGSCPKSAPAGCWHAVMSRSVSVLCSNVCGLRIDPKGESFHRQAMVHVSPTCVLSWYEETDGGGTNILHTSPASSRIGIHRPLETPKASSGVVGVTNPGSSIFGWLSQAWHRLPQLTPTCQTDSSYVGARSSRSVLRISG